MLDFSHIASAANSALDVSYFVGTDPNTTTTTQYMYTRSWSKPRGARLILMLSVSGGLPGNNGTTINGGGGGRSGACAISLYPAVFVSDTLSITPGSHGIGPSATSNARCSIASTGPARASTLFNSVYSDLTSASASNAAYASYTTAHLLSNCFAERGLTGTTTLGISMSSVGAFVYTGAPGGTPGAAGFGIDSIVSTITPPSIYQSVMVGGAAATATTPAAVGNPGICDFNRFIFTGGCGGGGGRAGTADNGGNGGAGAPGCGGGGGGASALGTVGIGGKGGPGFVIIVSW